VLQGYRVARQTRKAHKSNDGTKIKRIPNKKSCETSATISVTIPSADVAVKAGAFLVLSVGDNNLIVGAIACDGDARRFLSPPLIYFVSLRTSSVGVPTSFLIKAKWRISKRRSWVAALTRWPMKYRLAAPDHFTALSTTLDGDFTNSPQSSAEFSWRCGSNCARGVQWRKNSWMDSLWQCCRRC
jgi:hypothetical protein